MGTNDRKKSGNLFTGSRLIVDGQGNSGVLRNRSNALNNIFKTANAGPGPALTPTPTPTPTPYTITAGITTTTDNQILSSFRFDVLVGTSTDISIDWGDNSTIEYGNISSITNFPHTYELADNYIIGVTFSNPENVYEIRINQND